MVHLKIKLKSPLHLSLLLITFYGMSVIRVKGGGQRRHITRHLCLHGSFFLKAVLEMRAGIQW